LLLLGVKITEWNVAEAVEGIDRSLGIQVDDYAAEIEDDIPYIRRWFDIRGLRFEV
jgi:hypothetical protein